MVYYHIFGRSTNSARLHPNGPSNMVRNVRSFQTLLSSYKRGPRRPEGKKDVLGRPSTSRSRVTTEAAARPSQLHLTPTSAPSSTAGLYHPLPSPAHIFFRSVPNRTRQLFHFPAPLARLRNARALAPRARLTRSARLICVAHNTPGSAAIGASQTVAWTLQERG